MAGCVFPAARLTDLGALLSFIDGETERHDLPPDAAFAVRLAVEEAFTNVVRHGYADTGGPIRVSFEVRGGEVAVTIEDEAPLFIPSEAPLPDLESNLEQRAEGGLGWHLIRQLIDEIRHQPGAGGGNTVTLIKRLSSARE
jgi:serine/threonine-protein kinase RsbW